MKTSKAWLKKFIYLQLSIVLLIFICINYMSSKFEDKFLENKEYLLAYNPKVIFAGDSRAERQLIPSKASDILKLKHNDVVNISISSGDVVSIENIIKKNSKKFMNSTLIISISANQLNDATTEHGYFTYPMISKLNLFEQISIFAFNNIETLIYYYEYIFNNIKHKNIIKKDYSSTNGYLKIDTIYNPRQETLETIKKSYWYKNNNNFYNKKNKIVTNSLKYIKNNVKNLYIYSGPFAPSYDKLSRLNHHYQSENDFRKALKKICMGLDIRLLEYRINNKLKDEHFSDYAHLNKKGANIFTKILLSDIMK